MTELFTHGKAQILDGKEIFERIKLEVKAEVATMTTRPPGLATVLVGDRVDSSTYVRMKRKACLECNMISIHRELPRHASEDELLDVVHTLNEDDAVDAIYVQLPLPEHMDEERIKSAIAVHKDADGFHPVNMGRLLLRERALLFFPCLARGTIELLRRYGIEIGGKRAVVIGQCNIIGMPLALLLNHEDATVSIAHSKTPDLKELARTADILVVCEGQMEMVKSSWLKSGCVVLDAGAKYKMDSSAKRGYRLAGYVAFDECSKVASYITPVPGGLGPMTIAMVLRNCLDAALRRDG